MYTKVKVKAEHNFLSTPQNLLKGGGKLFRHLPFQHLNLAKHNY